MESHQNLIVLKQTPQLVALHTIIRDKNCTRKDFIFYSDRLISLVIEEGLNLAPVEPKSVITDTESVYTGVEFKKKICGVSVVRAGESMETALRKVCQGVRIGKILIQRDEDTCTPILHYTKFPKDIANRLVFLMDPMLATGGSAILAVETLINHGVTEKHIIFLNLISCPEGIQHLHSKYPNVKIVTSAVDKCLNLQKFIIPGIGDFGNRYFSGV